MKLINRSEKCWLAVNVDEVVSLGQVGFGSTDRAGSESKTYAGDRCFQLFTGNNIERAKAAVLHMVPNFLLFTDVQLTVDEAVQRPRINMFAS
ncbi:hypothetical protein [Acidicapsa acidisoli]|uniref:hypothetical protein n=1 Tax=Acidicapsa acidisoli TaxID=1615681 RepID=UPI0021E0A392|nr:hypothetical protein [Acidicapsa acidisoli]